MAFPKGRSHSEETRSKMSASQKKRAPISEGTRAKMRASALRRFSDPKEREKISEASRGVPKSDAHREAVSRALKGSKASGETRAKMSATRKGVSMRGESWEDSEETRERKRAAALRRYARPGEREKQAARVRAARLGKKHSPETIEAMKEARALQVVPFRDTKPELEVQKALRLRGVEFRTHAVISELGRHQWDIALDARRVLIEVDGCYWHGCERCCPHSEVGKMNRVRDTRLSESARKKGWAVIRLWEHEIASGEYLIRIGKQGIFEQVA